MQSRTASGAGRLLHPSSQVYRIAHGGILTRLGVAYVIHKDLSGFDAHTNVEVQAIGAPDLLMKLADALPDGNAGQHGTLRIVLVSNRSAEGGEDAVSSKLGHSATIPIIRCALVGLEEPHHAGNPECRMAHFAENPMSLCVPSQRGLIFEAPHRHKVTRLRVSKGSPSDRSTTMPPLTHNGPSGITAISTGRSGSMASVSGSRE